MAKKGAGKNRGTRKPKNKNKPKTTVAVDADLRYVATHVEKYLEGIPEAGQALITLGRDASYTVLEIAAEKKNADLEELGRKLAAIPPQVETNLDALRMQSVLDHLTKARETAETAPHTKGYEIKGGAIAFFDPKRLMENLVHHGRPRKDPSRLVTGDIAWFGLPTAAAMPVRFVEGAPPDGQPSARLRVKIESGVMFVGPPEASDGPRLGAVRKDPFGTALDQYLDRSRFVRMKPATYALFTQVDGRGGLTVFLAKDRDADSTDVLDLASMHEIPVFVDETTTA